MVSSAAEPSSSISFGGVSEASGSASETSGCSGGAGGGVLGGSVGGSEGGPEEVRSVDRWEVWTVGGRAARWTAGRFGRWAGRRAAWRTRWRAAWGAAGGFSGGASDGEGASAEAAQELQCRQSVPKHVVELGRFFIVSCFFCGGLSFGHGGTHFTDMAGLNSGCVPGKLLQPAWCRGYHAGLSFLRPGFNSRSGRHTIPLPSEPVHRTVFDLLWRASGTTSTATPTANQGSSRVEFGTSIQTQ